jgi:hypothetical protein
VIGLALFGGFFALFLTYASKLERAATSAPQLEVVITAEWGRELPDEKRTEDSRFIAQTVFVNTGQAGNYIDIDGSLTPYVPTDSDRAKRQHIIEGKQVLVESGRKSRYVAWTFVALPVIAAILGFMWASRHRGRLARG